MAKKFFDIFPSEFSVNHHPEPEGGEEKTEKKTKIKKVRQKIKIYPPLKILVSLVAVIVLLVLYLSLTLSKAEVEILPKTELLNFSEKITASESVKEIDFENKIIPAQIITEEKDLWQEFAATGTTLNEGKAEGTIRVYNKYNPPTAISLKATTHFLSDSGKYFRSPEKIYLPAAQIKNGKIVPSWAETRVVAIESGEEYNIGPAKFSVPKLSGTPYYYSIYAESDAAMKGGFKTEAKKVTTEDIEKAKDELTKKILENTENSLKEKLSSEFILFDNTILKEVVDESCVVKAGAVVDKFSCQTKAKARALVFNKSDLEKFVKEFILANIPDSKTIDEKNLKIDYNPELIDIKEGKITLNLDFSAKIYPRIDEEELITLMRQKTADQIREIINSRIPDQILQIKVNFWPFWVKKAPKNIKRINIKLNLE